VDTLVFVGDVEEAAPVSDGYALDAGQVREFPDELAFERA